MAVSDEQICSEAVQAFDRGDFITAIGYFTTLVENDGENFANKLNLAVTKFRSTACVSSAIFIAELNEIIFNLGIDAKRVTEQDARYPVVLYNLAVVLLNDYSFNQALDIVKLLELTINRSSSLRMLWTRVRFLHVYLLVKTHSFAQALVEIEQLEGQLKSPLRQNLKEMRLASNIRIKLQQYKTWCYLSTMSLKNAKREYKTLISLTGTTHPSYTQACLKAYHDYLRGNVKKALKTMMNYDQAMEPAENHKIFLKQGDNLNLTFKNNQACCEFYLRRPTCAIFQLKNSLDEGKVYSKSNSKNSDGIPIYCDAKRTKEIDIILYNIGISLVHLKKPNDAFPLLTECLKLYPLNPRLWLRVAEVCIMLHKPKNNDLTCLNAEKCYVRHIQMGNSRKFVYANETQQEQEESSQSETHDIDFDNAPKPTLNYASYCLDNSLLLMRPAFQNGFVNVYPSNPIVNRLEMESLRASILCASAYVALQMENYPLAIKRSMELLISVEGVSPTFTYLGKMYLGEAHLKYGNIPEAFDAIFEPLNLENVDYAPLYDKKEETINEPGWPGHSSVQSVALMKPIAEWLPNAEFMALAIRGYNQCVLAVETGNFDRATSLLKILLQKFCIHVPPELMRLAVHIYTVLGNKEEIDLLITNNSRSHYFQSCYG